MSNDMNISLEPFSYVKLVKNYYENTPKNRTTATNLSRYIANIKNFKNYPRFYYNIVSSNKCSVFFNIHNIDETNEQLLKCFMKDVKAFLEEHSIFKANNNTRIKLSQVKESSIYTSGKIDYFSHYLLTYNVNEFSNTDKISYYLYFYDVYTNLTDMKTMCELFVQEYPVYKDYVNIVSVYSKNRLIKNPIQYDVLEQIDISKFESFDKVRECIDKVTKKHGPIELSFYDGKEIKVITDKCLLFGKYFNDVVRCSICNFITKNKKHINFDWQTVMV